jgi:hypothetical protein
MRLIVGTGRLRVLLLLVQVRVVAMTGIHLYRLFMEVMIVAIGAIHGGDGERKKDRSSPHMKESES